MKKSAFIYKKISSGLFSAFPFLNNEYKRGEWVKKILESLPSGGKILDAGAGECRYKKYCSHLDYTSQDFSGYDGKGDGVGLQTESWDTSKIDIVSDVISIPVKENFFDYVLCTEVLEHIPYPHKAIAEFSRILKPEGKLILTAPFASFTHFAPFHFCSGFNSYWYKEILKNSGFEVLEISANGNYFEYLCQELVRFPLMLKKYSKIGALSYANYLYIIPLVFVIYILSKFTKLSESQACFGYHVIAKKSKNGL